MKEKPHPPKEVLAQIIYDKDGNPIGISTTDASLDWRGQEENTVVIIKPKPKSKL